jgi:hypothetical protein
MSARRPGMSKILRGGHVGCCQGVRPGANTINTKCIKTGSIKINKSKYFVVETQKMMIVKTN